MRDSNHIKFKCLAIYDLITESEEIRIDFAFNMKSCRALYSLPAVTRPQY